jgi:hypothetical protein
MAVDELTPQQAHQRANMDVLIPNNNGRRVDKNPGTRHTNSMRATLEKQIKATGSDRPVTLLNFNPTTLQINGGMFFPEVIPACPVDQPYVIHVFRETRWGHLDKGVGLDDVHRIEPFPAIPKVIAAEYMREYQQEKDGFGGVLCYVGAAWNYDKDGKITSKGELHPSTIKKGQTVMVPVITYVDGELVMAEEERDFHALAEIVRIKRNQSLMRDIQQANGWYENEEGRKSVNDLHRDKARMAKREGLIPDLPRWVLDDSAAMAKQPDACPSCAAVPKAGAVVCVNCSYVFNPLEAYRLSVIGHGHVSMDRLSAKEWELANALQVERVRAKGKVNGQ